MGNLPCFEDWIAVGYITLESRFRGRSNYSQTDLIFGQNTHVLCCRGSATRMFFHTLFFGNSDKLSLHFHSLLLYMHIMSGYTNGTGLSLSLMSTLVCTIIHPPIKRNLVRANFIEQLIMLKSELVYPLTTHRPV